MNTGLGRSDDRLMDKRAAVPSEPSLVIVSSAQDLNILRRRRESRQPFEVRIDLPGLDIARRAALERRLQRSAAACGCNEGTVAGLLYLIVIPALILTGRFTPSAPLEWATVGMGFVAALITGKVFGLVAARLTLSRTLNRIERAFQAYSKGA